MIFNIYKPVGWTSFDVVKKIRGITREKKVGHGGTLDPFAEGVLIIGTGADTKILTDYSGSLKSYRAVLKLGIETDTLDLEGKTTDTKPVMNLNNTLVESVLNSFIGEYEQTPPMYSAKRVDGVRLYKLARKNQIVDREPVKVNISSITIHDIKNDLIDFSVTCSKGTYIRVLGQDIAIKLDTVGHLIKLQRTAVGGMNVKDSVHLKEFEAEWMSTVH